jgi:threonine dehydratase
VAEVTIDPIPQIDRFEQAAALIDPLFLHTPLVRSECLDRVLGREILLRVETLTPIRSFKGRGASWLLQCLGREARAGLVCASAGNFGQGLAHAARSYGATATVFAAIGANPLRVEAMRGFGAEVRLEGCDFDAAKAAARAFASATSRIFVEDGLHPAIAEGAGTIARELEAADALGEAILVPLGNGSLVNGTGVWVKARHPSTRVIAVAAAGAPAMALSWRQGRAVESASADTIADGVAVRVPVPEALAVMQATVDDVLLVDDAAILRAMRLAFENLGLVVEPTGAVGLAALVADPGLCRGQRVSTVLCGSNVTAPQARAWLLDSPPAAG